MKTLAIETATQPLHIYMQGLDDDMLILTSNDKPTYVVIPIKNVDKESLALSTNPEFRQIIERSRKEIRCGQKLSLDEMKQEVVAMRDM
ncbi:MAG: hypothetical protein WHX52_11535 [Anaerolineae bacterium]